MLFRNHQQEKVLSHLAAVLRSVAGDEFEYEDHSVSLSILDRALAEALEIEPDRVALVDASLIEDLEPELQAHVGRVLALRASLLLDMGSVEQAAWSAHLALVAYRNSLSVQFDDEGGRYVAHYLHQLLLHDVAVSTFDPATVAEAYESLFDFYAEQGLIDRAEDMLFHALELIDAPGQLLRRGVEFYDSLLLLDPIELKRRGLPIKEVRSSRAELVDWPSDSDH
jgi:hypothetical protein